jgi:hypothetical protein
VDFIALLKKQLSQIGTVLASYTGDYCPLKGHAASPSSCLWDDTLGRWHRTSSSCFLDLSFPIVSEYSVLPAMAQAPLLEEG